MAKMRCVLKPTDFAMPFIDCPPGPFLYLDKHVAWKTEYGNDEAYCETGERFCGQEMKVIPLETQWEEME